MAQAIANGFGILRARLWTPVLAAAALLAVGSSARATMFVELVSGASTVTIMDNQAGFDLNPGAGQIFYAGAVGNFSTTITIATSNSPGTSADALLQVSSIDVTNLGTGSQTLQVIVGDTGFTSPSGTGLMLQGSYAGTLTNAQIGDTTSFESYADTSNTQGLTTGPTVTATGLQSYTVTFPGSLQPFSTSNAVATFSSPGPYSVTNITTITLSAGAQSNVSGTTQLTPAGGAGSPEPASLLLLAPATLALLTRRRRQG